MTRPWWEVWPGRLEFELKCLDDAGIKYRLDEQARAQGIIKIFLQHRVNGKLLDLVAIFPDLYPYFRFEVQAPNILLPRHQAPGGKNLCLIGRSTANWRGSDTLADSIQNQLPRVLKAARTPISSETEAMEEHQGEPATDYYQYTNDLAILVDSAWCLDQQISRGRLTLDVKAKIQGHAAPRLQALVKLIADDGGARLAVADPDLAQGFQSEFPGRWLRLNKRPPLAAPDELVRWLAGPALTLRQASWQAIGGARIDVIGVVFPEEVGYQKSADGWLFIVRVAKPGTNGRKWKSYYARAVRGGRIDMNGRIPELASLASDTVAVFGLGAIGASSTLELARAGFRELRLLDFDYVDPGTIVRWPLGLEAAGLLKTTSLPEFLAANYPYTRVKAYTHRLGGVRDVADAVKPDRMLLDEVLDGANIVYDATAEVGIQHLLSDLARERGIPYVSASATEGGWGGLIARIRPGKTEGCWYCLMHHLDTGSISTPPRSPTGTLQPIGCANPTFVGTGFDLTEVAIAGVRLTIATLCSENEKGYPDYDWDVGCLSLRNPDGKLIAPRWDTLALTRHARCESCNQAAA